MWPVLVRTVQSQPRRRRLVTGAHLVLVQYLSSVDVSLCEAHSVLLAIARQNCITTTAQHYHQAASQYYVDAAYYYRRSSVVCRSVCWSVCLSGCLSLCLSQSSAVQKPLNRSRCRLGCGLGVPCIRWGPDFPCEWAIS